MAFIAVAIGGAALLGAGASIASSSMQADATQSAADTAAASQMNANQLNYKQFQESRGSNGSAVMPLYLKNPDGSLFEKSMGNDLVSGYNNSAVPLSSFQKATDSLQPAMARATRTTNDIFNGGITKSLLDNTAPVRAQRTSLARSTSLDALNKTLADINATQAGHGFGGDSYASRMAGFGAQKAAGDAIGSASLQNKQDVADMTNYGDISLPIQNLQTPGAVGTEANNFAFMPQANWLNSLNQRMQPLSMVRIGTGQPFQYQPLPTAGPGAYMGGANGVSGAVGSLSNGVSSYMNYKNQQDLLAAFNNGGGGYNPAIGTVPFSTFGANAYSVPAVSPSISSINATTTAADGGFGAGASPTATMGF